MIACKQKTTATCRKCVGINQPPTPIKLELDSRRAHQILAKNSRAQSYERLAMNAFLVLLLRVSTQKYRCNGRPLLCLILFGINILR